MCVQFNRSLRTAPGLRAIGKHWEMDSMSSEIDTDDTNDDNDDEVSKCNVSIFIKQKFSCSIAKFSSLTHKHKK